MVIMLDAEALPERGAVELNIHRSFEIKTTAEEARRKVNRWLVIEVSNLIGADPPTLVVGERIVWRVPAWIGFPRHGRVGTVGTVDVDVETGEMDNVSECKAAIECCAQEIASRLPPGIPRCTYASSPRRFQSGMACPG